MYYTKREYNKMKNVLTSENKKLKKEIEKLKKKIKELEYTKEVVFEPDFELTPTDIMSEDIPTENITLSDIQSKVPDTISEQLGNIQISKNRDK